MRPDALRNRARILEAARAEVAARGVEVGMDEIAAAAGVAVGTLYRHFPTKADLLRATVDASIVEMAAVAESAMTRVQHGSSAGTEVATLFRTLATQHATDQAVKEASAALGHPVSSDVSTYGPDTAAGRGAVTLQWLLAAAQEEGSIRTDVSLVDLVTLLGGVPGTGADESARDRYVDIVLRGLQP